MPSPAAPAPTPATERARRLIQTSFRKPLLACWIGAAVLLGLATAAIVGYVKTASPAAGLRAAGAVSDTAPADAGIDTTVDPLVVASVLGLDARSPFTAEWRGHLVVLDPGTHHIRARADDGVAVWIDDAAVIDRIAHVGEQEVSASLALARGLHPIRVRYRQSGGDALLRVSWATPPSRERFTAVRVIADGDRPGAFARAERVVWWPQSLALAWSAWVLSGLLLAFAWLMARVARVPRIVGAVGPRAVAALALVALPLLAATIDVGTQPWRGWAPDEIKPSQVEEAWDSGLGRGWFHLYPPLPFYLLNLVHAPVRMLAATGVVSVNDAAVHAGLHVVDRMLSLGYGWLTLLAVALLTRAALGGSAARLSPLVLAGLPLFAFYARTTNVDMGYVFWVVLGALAFLNAFERRDVRDHAVLGLMAAAAVATKDQAYGFFAGPAVLLAWAAWREAGAAGSSRLLRTLADAHLWSGLATFAAAYSVLLGVWWNFDGVRGHIGLITGQGSAPFRMFPATANGLQTLAATTIAVGWQALGPVVTLAALAGLVRGLSDIPRYRVLWLLCLMPLGYLVSFVGVVGYVYDRFLLGPAIVAAMLAAFGIDWALMSVRRGLVRAGAAALIASALLLPAAALAWRQLHDSRTATEAWMRASITDDPLVLGAGSLLYLPNLFPFQHRLETRTSAENLLGWDAGVIVLYEDWFGRPRQPSIEAVRHTLEAAGYEERFTAREPRPAQGWLPVLVSGLYIDPVFSNIGKINPPLSVWQRQRGGTAAVPER